MEHECVVVGGGILGLFTALRVRKELGFEVTVLVPPQQCGQIPRIDSVRNHAWLQSGALYPGLAKAVGPIMRWSGLMLHEELGLPIPTTRGVFRVDARSEEELMRTMDLLQLGHELEDLSDAKAKDLLMDLFLPGFKHYGVPDTPFDEALVLNTAKAYAKYLGVQFLEAEVDSLKQDDQSGVGASLMVGGMSIRADYVVLCCGTGIPSLLESLQIEHPLQVQQSVLITLNSNGHMRAPLFVDRTRNLSAVRHRASDVLRSGAIVLGGIGRCEVADPNARRKVLPEEKEKIVQILPEPMRSKARSAPATAGHKTEAVKDGNTSVEPYVACVPNFPGLIYAVPGKATLAYWAAQLVGQLLKKLKKSPRARRISPKPSLAESTEKYRMHHELAIDETAD